MGFDGVIEDLSFNVHVNVNYMISICTHFRRPKWPFLQGERRAGYPLSMCKIHEILILLHSLDSGFFDFSSCILMHFGQLWQWRSVSLLSSSLFRASCYCNWSLRCLWSNSKQGKKTRKATVKFQDASIWTSTLWSTYTYTNTLAIMQDQRPNRSKRDLLQCLARLREKLAQRKLPCIIFLHPYCDRTFRLVRFFAWVARREGKTATLTPFRFLWKT